MWLLTNHAGERTYLRANRLSTIGRKNADIILQDDTSISRLHAIITVKPLQELKTTEPTSVCTLTDTDSKYGTFLINGDEACEVPKTGYILKDKDIIRFGLQNSTFVVTYIPLITAVSSLTASDESHIEAAIENVDGMVTNVWSENCTHLTVSSATLTEKIVCAMAQGMFIVTASYWDAVQDAVEKRLEIPDPLPYVPKLSEMSIDKDMVSLAPNAKRSTLFKDLIFVFFDAKQFKIYGRMVTMAGGNCILFAKKPLKMNKMCASNIIVMRCYEGDESQSTQSTQSTQSSQSYQTNMAEYEEACKVLRESKRRTIPDSEIPLAILHCSKEKYCNPRFLFEEILKSSQRNSNKFKSADVIAIDTQDATLNVGPRKLPKIMSDISIISRTPTNSRKRSIDVVSSSQDTVCVPETMDVCDTQSALTDNARSKIAKILLAEDDSTDATDASSKNANFAISTSSSGDKNTSVSPSNSSFLTSKHANLLASTPLSGNSSNANAKKTLAKSDANVTSPTNANSRISTPLPVDEDKSNARRSSQTAYEPQFRCERKASDDSTASTVVSSASVKNGLETPFTESDARISEDSMEMTETTETNETFTGANTVSASDHVMVNGKIRSLFRSVPGRKTFKKANVIMPKERIKDFDSFYANNDAVEYVI